MLNFIGRLFGVAPDNGYGAIEIVLLIFLIVLMFWIALRLMITKEDPSS